MTLRLRGMAAAFVSSHVPQEKGVTGARPALRVDRVASFPNVTSALTLTSGALVQRADCGLSFFLFRRSVRFSAGHGLGEKPTRGELVTHRVPPPSISSYDLSLTLKLSW